MRASDWHPVASSTSSMEVSIAFHHESHLCIYSITYYIFMNWFVNSSPGSKAESTGSLMHVLLRLLQPARGVMGAEV